MTKEKFERFRDTIRGSVTYKGMVIQEIAASEQLAKAKEDELKTKTNMEPKSINPACAPTPNGLLVPILRFSNFHVGLEQSGAGSGEHSAS